MPVRTIYLLQDGRLSEVLSAQSYTCFHMLVAFSFTSDSMVRFIVDAIRYSWNLSHIFIRPKLEGLHENNRQVFNFFPHFPPVFFPPFFSPVFFFCAQNRGCGLIADEYGNQILCTPFKQRLFLTTCKLAQGLPDIATANVCKLDSKYCNAFIIYRLME